MDEIILAKDIDDCDNCPLYQHDCPGGWTSGAGGTPIEPPCCSWNGDEEIYEGMYDDAPDYDYYDEEWECYKQENSKQAERKQRIEELEREISRYTDYGNATVRDNGTLVDSWYCPRCHNWSRPDWSHSGINTHICPICHTRLAHSYELENLLKESHYSNASDLFGGLFRI